MRFTKAYRRAVDDPAIEEAVVLSTCNRIEIYGSVPSYHAGFQALKRLLCESREVDAESISEPLYSHYEDDAAAHLFSVAAGLDSMVLGEPQILSQVREALRRSTAEGATGPALTGLFHAAARAGRTVRTDTAVGAAPDAFIAAGADLAAETLGGLDGKHALVVGAGQMSALAIKHLRRRGVGTVRVLNRSIERARALAERADAEHGDLDALPDAIAAADLVISATGAAGIIFTEDVLRTAVSGRQRPLFVLDLAVPRDVEPAAGTIEGVHLVDIDGLREALDARDAGAAEDIAKRTTSSRPRSTDSRSGGGPSGSRRSSTRYASEATSPRRPSSSGSARSCRASRPMSEPPSRRSRAASSPSSCTSPSCG